MKELPIAFIYNTGKIAVVGSASAEFTLNFSGSTDFYARYMTVSIDQANVNITTWAGTVDIEDGHESWFNRPINAEAIGGNGQLPYVFEPRKKIAASASLVISLVDVSTVNTNVEIAFHGYRLTKGAAVPLEIL
ncbi:MAG: hypothetical protein ACYTBJ_06795 [Planctomycetota bacterium]|jgi:hypothetical protein